MPRKRRTAGDGLTSAQRALRAAVLEELRVPLTALSEKQEAKLERNTRKFFERVRARGDDIAAVLAVTAKEDAKRKPYVDTYEDHHASAVLESSAPAFEPAALDDDEPIEPRKTRKRVRVGVSYVHPELVIDSDDWDD